MHCNVAHTNNRNEMHTVNILFLCCGLLVSNAFAALMIEPIRTDKGFCTLFLFGNCND